MTQWSQLPQPVQIIGPDGKTPISSINPLYVQQLVQGVVAATAPSTALQVGGVDPSGNLQPLQLDSSLNLKTTGGGGGGGGTSSTFGAAFPVTGTAVGASDGTNMQPLLVTGTGLLKTQLGSGSSIVGIIKIVDATGANELAINAAGAASVISTPIASSTSALTSVANANSSTQLLASNSSRKGYRVFNEGSAILYLAESGSASTTVYTTQVPPNVLWESPATPAWQGAVFAICPSATGNARITELT